MTTAFEQHLLRKEKGLSVTAEVLLDLVTSIPHQFTTVELMKFAQNHDVASPATLHAAITSLKDKKYISATRSKKDKRIVFLKPTKKGMEYYDGCEGL